MAVISVVAKIVLSVILMQWLAHGGLALSTSLASMLNLGLLVRALRVKLGALGWRNITESVCKTMICSGIMGAVVWVTALFIIPSGDGNIFGLFFGLMGSIVIGIVLYGSFSLLLKSRELEKVLAIAGKGMRKK
jgi:putative peptidoglycan lipid II flippase